jgi:glycine/D-amino acid oxidase-like deaminating enzyme/nitrite reductase/ring-hydroxylating ferredoxin subunit
MRHDQQSTVSLWSETPHRPADPPLVVNTEAEVVVVGAGIAGMTTAYLLAKEGKRVVVLDAGQVGEGQTERTTAHLSNAIDDRYVEIERIHGAEGARIAAASHTAAIAQIETIVRTEGIDCDLERVDGYLFEPAVPRDSDTAASSPKGVLVEEQAAANRAGVVGLEIVPRAPLGTFDTGPALRFAAQGQFHPMKYLRGLAQAFTRLGGVIHGNTRAVEVTGGATARVVTDQGSAVVADAVVVATNTPINDRVAIHTKQAGYITYVVAFRIQRGLVPHALFWDTQDPYHYIRVQRGATEDEELLIVGGEDHKVGQAHDTAARFDRLAGWARWRLPFLGTVAWQWSGQVMETIDGLAFIGRNPLDADNVYVATGDSGMGMTHGTIAGMLLTDLIVGRGNPWASLYDPSRKTLGALPEFAHENLNTLRQYSAWVTPGDVDDLTELKPGSGAIIRRGTHKIAAYRDEKGMVHECSAVCPHLFGIVGWNDTEKTWDCPCHGSRFDRFGEVIQGPANQGLSPAPSAKPAPSREREHATRSR